jgi:hypothetical protein
MFYTLLILSVLNLFGWMITGHAICLIAALSAGFTAVALMEE